MNGNFKVRALETHNDFFTKGDVFIFKNGITTWKNENESLTYDNFLELIGRNSGDNYLEEVKEGENKMEDLRELIKPCMVVKFRDGRLGKVEQIKNDELALYDILDSSSWMNFDYNEDLTFSTSGWKQWDIMEIYGYSHCGNKEYATTINSRPLIWKREEKSPTQLKIEEIESTIAQLTNQVNELKSK